MLTFHNRYTPLTSHPFQADSSYREYLPCSLLRPYLVCYWMADGAADESAAGTHSTNKQAAGIPAANIQTVAIQAANIQTAGKQASGVQTAAQMDGKVLVIPDTCMDIIVRVNHTRQTISGYLCGLQDKPFTSKQTACAERITCFAIRFHFWAAHLFVKLDYRTVRNEDLMLSELGAEWNRLFHSFLEVTDVHARIRITEDFLLKRLPSQQPHPDLFNSIDRILGGTISVRDICEYSCVSQRQLERIVLERVGLPLKRICGLVRYQRVWREMLLSPSFDIQEAVYRYGYTDQSHLLKDFRRFHAAAPEEAKRIAGLTNTARYDSL